jgi:glycosyltransferase involved in cell wall biosynthesis
MSVYNGQNWLTQSINSVLTQTFTDFEFLIIDDGSIDKSFEIMQSFKKKDLRIRVFKKSNSGLTDSLNYGLKKAKGNWIARIDSDDLCRSNRLKKQIELAHKDKSIILIGSGLQLIDENGAHGKTYFYPESSDKLKRQIYEGRGFFPHSSAFIRADKLNMVGGYRSRFKRSQDQDLWLRLSEIGPIACIKEPLVFIRKHPSQLSNQDSGFMQTLYSQLAMTSYHLRQLNNPDPIFDHDTQNFEKFYDFVNRYLTDNSQFQVKSVIENIKITLQNKETLLKKKLALFKLFLRNPKCFIIAIFYILYKPNISYKIALTWIAYNR